MTETPQAPLSLRHRIEDRTIGALVGAMRLLPYKTRVRAMGWIARNILAPLALNKRTRANLAYIFPDMPEAEVRAVCRDVADNFGRAMMELHSGAEFARYAADMPIHGPGLAALDQAHAENRPVILVTAHYGNYDAWRAALTARGFRVGGLYKPMSNPASNARYVATIESIAKPLFPSDKHGMADMVRFLRAGGMLGMLVDHYMSHGELLDFLGKPAWTATSAAKLALKYNALLVPGYATRNADGFSFAIDVEEPIPHSDATTMTQALNDSAAARVMAHKGQWFWLHRRWKNTPDNP
ncbi:lysophospholipid acyltransferase family protein [Pararhodobacter oceanensis]|uniref:lysophospholipid acyltransferase family protein n=1 Tax=Pararhodobacter oceanensis TaxID=2172121 RepID=UPI003A9146C3